MNLFYRGFPKINTERLTLRQVEKKDLQDLYQLFNSVETKKFQNSHYYSNEELIDYIDNIKTLFNNQEQIVWILERKSDNAFIGIRILYNDGNDRFEIQGDTKTEYWRNGYTKEAYCGLIKFIKNTYNGSVAKIYSEIQNENVAAIRLVSSLNFDFQKSYVAENGKKMMIYQKIIF